MGTKVLMCDNCVINECNLKLFLGLEKQSEALPLLLVEVPGLSDVTGLILVGAMFSTVKLFLGDELIIAAID